MQSIRFERCGERDGCALYALWIGRERVEEGLAIDEVIERINRFEEDPRGRVDASDLTEEPVRAYDAP